MSFTADLSERTNFPSVRNCQTAGREDGWSVLEIPGEKLVTRAILDLAILTGAAFSAVCGILRFPEQSLDAHSPNPLRLSLVEDDL